MLSLRRLFHGPSWLFRKSGLFGRIEQLEHQLRVLHEQLDRMQATIVRTGEQTNFLTYQAKSRVVVRGRVMQLDPSDTGVAPQLFYHGMMDPLETQLVQQLVRAGDTVIDVGANIGYYTLLFSELVGDNGRVIAFEPDPSNFALLERNVLSNGCRNVTLVPKAVAAASGKLRLYASPDNKGDHRIYDSGDGRRTIDIDAVALDDWLSDDLGSIQLIKMDIQGAEVQALSGMTEFLQTHPETRILTEFWPAGLTRCGASAVTFLDALQQLGFEWTEIDNERRVYRAVAAEELLEAYTPENEKYTNLLCTRAVLEAGEANGCAAFRHILAHRVAAGSP